MNAIEWLNELGAKADAATSGPWVSGEVLERGTVVHGHNMIIDCRHMPDEGCFGGPNAAFIAAANPETVKRLVRMLEWFAKDSANNILCPMPDAYKCSEKSGDNCTCGSFDLRKECWIQAAYECTETRP